MPGMLQNPAVDSGVLESKHLDWTCPKITQIHLFNDDLCKRRIGRLRIHAPETWVVELLISFSSIHSGNVTKGRAT